MAEIKQVEVDGVTYDLRDASAVKSVNGTSPDEAGNVAVTLPSVPSAGTGNPAMDGVASPGSAVTWSRSDHVHPTDTSRAAASHTHTASQVTAGTFAGAVVANSSGQTAGNKLIRNSKLLDATTYDAVTDWSEHLTNGEIAWRYE